MWGGLPPFPELSRAAPRPKLCVHTAGFASNACLPPGSLAFGTCRRGAACTSSSSKAPALGLR